MVKWGMLGLLACAAPLCANAWENTFGVGIEGFHDEYREPSLSLTDTTNYGSVTAYAMHETSNGTFFALDGRVSHGKDNYESPSGTLSGVPQWEYEVRGRVGYSFPFLGGELSPYTGLGDRYFEDLGKGYVTNTGAEAYDRRINQIYLPIGTSLAWVSKDGWSITPQAEGDLMFYGSVDSRLTNVTGTGVQYLNPADNTQHLGFGLRSELMFGKSFGGYNFQLGPFVRYWYVQKSDTVTYLDKATGQPAIDVYEPTNNRVQVGVAVRMVF